jgi:hypothetical protein
MTTEERDEFNFMVNCPAWPKYKLRLAMKAKENMNKWLDPGQTRPDTESDEFLRGWIRALTWAVAWPEREIAEAADSEENLT